MFPPSPSSEMMANFPRSADHSRIVRKRAHSPVRRDSWPGSPALAASGGGAAAPRRGFSLVEILVTISVAGLLVLLFFPAFSRALETANMAKCSGNLRSIGRAIAFYAADNNNHIPSVVDPENMTWDAKLLPYLEDAAVFHCPSDRLGSVDPAKFPRSYAANGGVAYGVSPDCLPFGNFWKDSAHRLSTLTSSGDRLILIGERPGDSAASRGLVGKFPYCSIDVIPSTAHHKGRGGLYLFADMGVEYLTAEQVARESHWYMR